MGMLKNLCLKFYFKVLYNELNNCKLFKDCSVVIWKGVKFFGILFDVNEFDYCKCILKYVDEFCKKGK